MPKHWDEKCGLVAFDHRPATGHPHPQTLPSVTIASPRYRACLSEKPISDCGMWRYFTQSPAFPASIPAIICIFNDLQTKDLLPVKASRGAVGFEANKGCGVGWQEPNCWIWDHRQSAARIISVPAGTLPSSEFRSTSDFPINRESTPLSLRRRAP